MAEPSFLAPDASLSAQKLLALGCTYSGWLRKMHQKQSMPNNAWHQKYVVLHQGCLYCYPHEVAVVPTTYLSLYGYNYVKRSLQYRTRDRPWVFYLEPVNAENRALFFSTGSEREMKDWMKFMKIEMLRANGRESDTTILDDIKRVEDKIYADVNEIWSKMGEVQITESHSDHEDDINITKPLTAQKFRAGALTASSLTQDSPGSTSTQSQPNGQSDNSTATSTSDEGSSQDPSSMATSQDHIHYTFRAPEGPDQSRKRGIMMGPIEMEPSSTEPRYRTGGSVRFNETPVLGTPNSAVKSQSAGNGADTLVGILRSSSDNQSDNSDPSPVGSLASRTDQGRRPSKSRAAVIWDSVFFNGDHPSAIRELREIGISGAYLIRKSFQKPGEHTLVFWEGNSGRKYKIYEQNTQLFLFESHRFSSVEQLLFYYSSNVIPGSSIKLSEPYKVARLRLEKHGSGSARDFHTASSTGTSVTSNKQNPLPHNLAGSKSRKSRR